LLVTDRPVIAAGTTLLPEGPIGAGQPPRAPASKIGRLEERRLLDERESQWSFGSGRWYIRDHP
jgi:hypothetical protein